MTRDYARAQRGERAHGRVPRNRGTVTTMPSGGYYSPDLNPIEPCWSKLKQLVKKFEALTLATLDAAIARAVELITPDDARGWFAHCGYQAQLE